MAKQSFDEKIKAGKAKFRAIRKGHFWRLNKRTSLGVALRRDIAGNVDLQKISRKV